MKKSLFVIVILFTIASYYLYIHYKPTDKYGEFVDVRNPITLQLHSDYLIPVSHFTNIRTNYSLEEFSLLDVISLEENLEKVPEFVDVEIVEEQNLHDAIQNGKFALLNISQVEPIYKSLSINDQSFWDKELDIKKYPFATHTLIIANQDEYKNLRREDIYSIFAGGEIIPARAVDRLGLNKYNNYTYLFDFFKEDIENAVISMGLLENSLKGNPNPCTGCVTFVGDDQVAKGLEKVGFDILSTAGNHAGDGGQSAYKNTAALFDETKIQLTGTGRTDEELLEPAILNIQDQKVGVLAADDIAYFYWGKITNDSTYGTNSFSNTSNWVTTVDEERVQRISEIKTENQIDYLIIFMSWGVEYTNWPTAHQQNLAHKLIDNGADLILSSHPHWVQSVEFYNSVPIIYSMGNFIFDQTHTTPTRQGTVINLYYYLDELKSIDIIPHQTCGYHQTKNDITGRYLNGEISMDEVYNYNEKEGCVYWQPKKLKDDDPAYKDILKRVFEYSKI